MLIRSVAVENFRGFVHDCFELDEHFTLIIGTNGVGKTSLLEAIAIGLGGYLGGLGLKGRNILREEVRLVTDHLGDATVVTLAQYPVRVSCTGVIDDTVATWTRTLESERGRTTRYASREIVEAAKRMSDRARNRDHSLVLPLVSYQSAGRLFSQKKEKWSNPFGAKDALPSRFVGYTDCLESESNIKLFVHWLERMTQISLQKQTYIGELQAVLNAITEFMVHMTGSTTPMRVYFDFEYRDVMVQDNSNTLPLRMLSAGYRTLIGMVADLAYRMTILNPQLRDDAAKLTPGVILIDELDLHIHPKWQWRIVKALRAVFPVAQFVATTHSPLIISSFEEGNLLELDEDALQLASSERPTPYGWSVDDVLTQIMDAASRAPSVQDEINKLRDILARKARRGLSTEEQNRLWSMIQRLNDLLPESDPAITVAKIEAAMEAARR